MKKRTGMQVLPVLLAFLLVSVVMAPAVSAQQSDNPEVDQGQDIGVGGMELTHTSPSTYSDISRSGLIRTSYDWIAGTDIYDVWNGPVKSTHYSKSRISGTSTIYDIPTIGVRGRVWRDDNLQLDETDENYNSADASVEYTSTGWYKGGYWEAQSDHTFEYPANNDYWYPITTDDVDV